MMSHFPFRVSFRSECRNFTVFSYKAANGVGGSKMQTLILGSPHVKINLEIAGFKPGIHDSSTES